MWEIKRVKCKIKVETTKWQKNKKKDLKAVKSHCKNKAIQKARNRKLKRHFLLKQKIQKKELNFNPYFKEIKMKIWSINLDILSSQQIDHSCMYHHRYTFVKGLQIYDEEV